MDWVGEAVLRASALGSLVGGAWWGNNGLLSLLLQGQNRLA